MNKLWPAFAALVRAVCILAALLTIPPAFALEPVPVEFFKHQYGPQLPSRAEGGVAGYLESYGAASTGDGGWLTCWVESGRQDHATRLMVRLLPAAFNSPPSPIPEGWADIAAGSPIEITTGPGVGGFPIGGEGGALLVWSGGLTGTKAQWFSQGEGGAAGTAVSLEPGLWEGTGSGGRFWLFSSQYPASTNEPGVVLERSGAGIVAAYRFSINRTLFPFGSLCAGQGRCLFSSFFYGTSESPNVRTLTVDAAGQVSPVNEQSLPPGAVWLGAISHNTGFFGVWRISYPTGMVIEGRAMTPDGTWVPGSPTIGMGPVAGYGSINLTPGPGVAILDAGAYQNTALMLVRPGQPLRALDQHDQFDVYATDGARLLTLQRYGANRLQARRTMLEYDFTKPPIAAGITSGPGRQSDPALAWTTTTPAGPRIVFQVEGYGNQNSQPITGGDKAADRPAGARFFTGSFSSPAQAWQGNLQLIAWRSATSGADGPDDVSGVLSSVAADGTFSTVRGPFLIAGGPGSQRAVAVSAEWASTGFSVVWRHEEGRLEDGSYLTEIRTASISAAGVVTPPGGKLMDISLGELSAPDVDWNVCVYRVPQSPGAATTMIRRASPKNSSGGITWQDLSPHAHDAVSPRILAHGPFSAVTWRDKITSQIFLHRDFASPVLSAVSPLGQRVREPGIALVSWQHFAIVWLEERQNRPSRVWMALADNQSVGSPVPVLEGWFDRDTLAVSGDGKGRLAIAVRDVSTDTPGLKVTVVAPFSSRQGGLAISPAADGMQVSWNYDPVTFPPLAATLETSPDLRQWQPVSGGPPTASGSGRVSLVIPRQQTELHRYFRLRASLTGP